MTVTYCDITDNEIENGTTSSAWRIRQRRYTTIQGKDLSSEGVQKLEAEMYSEMKDNDRFNFREYKRILSEKLAQLTE